MAFSRPLWLSGFATKGPGGGERLCLLRYAFPTRSDSGRACLGYIHAVTHVLAKSAPSSFTAPCCWEIFDDAMRDGNGRYMR